MEISIAPLTTHAWAASQRIYFECRCITQNISVFHSVIQAILMIILFSVHAQLFQHISSKY